MACSVCGSNKSLRFKHLPLPDGREGWIELSEFTEYCTPCAKSEALKLNAEIQKAKENKHGTIS